MTYFRKPRRHERLAMYKRMLRLFQEDIRYKHTSGFCNALAKCSSVTCRFVNRSVDIYDYPELYAFRPTNMFFNSFWFPISIKFYQTVRIDILKKIIKDMEK